MLLLALYLLAYLAEVTWRLLPEPALNNSASPVITAQSSHTRRNPNQLNLAAVKRLNLFGEVGTQPEVIEEEVTEAPETKLNLTLNGVVSTQDPEQGTAIIEHSGIQNTYGVGEKIEGTQVVLKKVYADRVIIRNRVVNETLMLDGIDYASQAQAQIAQPRPTPTNRVNLQERNGDRRIEQRRLSDDALRATRDLQRRPAQFTDYIAISPYAPQGKLQGYRISPGRKPSLFKEAGFQGGDIVKDINGLELADPQQAMQAMAAMRESQSLSLTIERKGETLTLQLDMPEEQ